ncbi:branched-chain amino acid ABC transporter permease/ATP-binding protein, partial [Blastococcus sp. URHD0036]|uniref:branched-chain amino acid ABC transporter permease/ATP-binding protein n=1 Tax=Blastococcus sp. URHD0036 TaxID=1380356 RepID=UPI000496EA1B
MSEFLQFLLLGLGAGGIYALLALGVVVVYRGSGVVNFANGAFALLGASFFYELRDRVGIPVAILVGILAGVVAGVLVQLLVMRPMRHASPLARVIATLGLLTVAQEAAKQRYGSNGIFVKSVLPQDSVDVTSDISVGEDRLLLLAITVGLFAVFYLVYRRTRFGLATTGVAENEIAMSSLGWSPNVVAAINWGVGGGVAALAGVLLVPITGLSPTSLTLSIIPALSAALVGGFSSLPLTFLGGLLVGVLEAEATRYVDYPGSASAAPFLIIVVILVIRGKALPLRSHLNDRLPRIGTGRIRWQTAVVLGLLTLISLWVFTGDWAVAMTTTAVYALICLSLVVLTGYAGQLSLAQFSIAGIGALISSRLADSGGLPFPIAAVLGVLLTVPVALLVALPALRARGVNLAVVTLGLAVVVSAVVLANPDIIGDALHGIVVPEPRIFGFSVFAVDHPERYAALSVILFIICAVMVSNLRRGRAGRRFIAVRDNERAAASLGISIVGAKMYAFGLAGAIAAVAGVLTAFRFPNVQFEQYDAFASIAVVLLAVIGGIGFISGSIVGALGAAGAAFELVLSRFVDLSGWFPFIAAVILVLTVVLSPDGVVHAQLHEAHKIRARVSARRARGRAASAAEERPDRASAPEPVETPGGATQVAAAPVSAVPPRHFEIRNVTMRFGGVTALEDVSLSIAPGEVVGLIGPNGAGKTTLIEVASGFHRSYEGSVLFDGRSIDRLNAVKRARSGLTRSFQSLELFEDLDVDANIRAACDERSLRKDVLDLFRPDRSRLSAAGVASVREFEMQDELREKPSDLPYARRRLVAIARAVATSPSILLLDEPAAGLDARSTRELGVLIRRLAAEWGMGILLIEHDVSMVLSTCDKVVALNFGRVVASGTPEEIRRDPQVIESYLGAAANDTSDGALADQDSAPASVGTTEGR